ncbi:TetR/AcrR family transcriptional regulator [Phaeovulum sp.]|uniref:TetR/AcrR family transcriptional regulator n=1 Tax=Phaeovulum sp. TaxID=2934796 RepID=UPI002731CD9F|nr:TetR/AcrR family transcriptional regulator [Phaeovulum sp.]MDP1668163.1 TetR/AcrR family transcriptional regulator [Phaeovulum sp.]MDZ4119800.1 TetR/AcrR family transcriptional regulator [Phaeovulum sp.]
MPTSAAVLDTPQDAAESLLDAAEAQFSENGFHGTTTRGIAAAAGVNAALLHYYFGSKEQLFATVVERRAAEINGRRRALLAALLAETPTPSLAALLAAFLRPTIEFGHDTTRDGQRYARLLVHVAAGTDERSRRLTAQNYNGIAQEFITLFCAAVPGLARKDAVRGYLFAVSIALSLMGRTGRAGDLSEGACHDEDVDAAIEEATVFAAAGIRALAAHRKDN